MSMRIQDALSNCCEGIKDFTSTAASWIGKTVTTAGGYISDLMSKIAEIIKPHFEQVSKFAQENNQSILIFAAGAAIIAVGTVVANAVFCRGTQPTSTSTSAATSAASSTTI